MVDLNEDHGNQTVQEIAAKGEAIFSECDVGSSEQIQATIKAALNKWTKIDVVVNDAAMMTFKPILELPDDDFDKVLNVNLRSVFLFCKYAVPHMPKGGAIVNLSSVHAHETTKNVVPYASSKGGIEAFTRGASEEFAPLKDSHQLRRARCGKHAHALGQPEYQKRRGESGGRHWRTGRHCSGDLLPRSGRSSLHHRNNLGCGRRPVGHSLGPLSCPIHVCHGY